MSTYSSTQWSCDRCGAMEELGARNAGVEQPIGWASLYEVKPPLKNPSENDLRPDQICRACLDSFHDWFTSGRLAATP